MDVGTIALVTLLIFAVTIVGSFPVSIALGLTTIATMLVFGMPLNMYSSIVYAGMAKFTMLAIPYFIIAGVIMERAGISRRLIKLFALIVGNRTGGMAIASVLVCLLWGAISGSGPATVAALGVTLIPGMISLGYKDSFAAAVVASASGIAVIIPPSINLVVYGVVAGESIGTLFTAGFLPGIVIGICFIIYAYFISKKRGYKGERNAEKGEIWNAVKDAFWGLLSPIIILGGIYGSIFTPTEAAAVAIFYGLFVGIFIYKEINIKTLPKIMADSGVSSASILFIMANASVLTWLMTSQGIATYFGEQLMGVSSNPYILILLMALLMLISGFFIDGISITYLFLPIFMPILQQYNMSMIWFGLIMTVAISIGFITPPVAVNLYPACNISGVTLEAISKEIIGFVIAGIIGLLLLIFFPEIVLIIPKIAGML